jgi:hypothetical protein
MPTEREFLRRRLERVTRKLEDPPRPPWEIPRSRGASRDRGRRRHDPFRPPWEQLPDDGDASAKLQTEARLLRKLLATAPEGRALRALEGWRARFDPRRKPLPYSQRDRAGGVWIIDRRFLEVLDDLIERLRKWRQADGDGEANRSDATPGTADGPEAHPIQSPGDLAARAERKPIGHAGPGMGSGSAET